jgi:long-chain fatty acid transport protein
MKNNNFKVAASLVLGTCLIPPFTAQASGFRIPEISVAGIGTSNSLVADTQTPGALPYNPAAMSFHEEGGMVFGMAQIRPDTHVTPSNGTPTNSQGSESIYVPNVFATNHINAQWSWGIGVNAPFGLETKWPAGTYQTFNDVATTTASPLVAVLEPEHSKLEMINVQANLAYLISPQTSVSLGVNQFIVRTLVFNTQRIEIEGDGRKLGWNADLQHTAGPWSFGVAYRPSITVDLKGHVDATAVGSTKSTAKAKLAFPSLLQAGARYQATSQWAVEMDYERTGWSSFDVIEIERSSGSTITSSNQWHNTVTYRLGTTFQLSPGTQLRFGYAREKTPQDDEFFTARIPDNDRQTLSAGIAHSVNGWLIEASYMRVSLDDRTVNAPADSFLANVVAGNTDPNGTDAYNGKYQSSAHVLGLGVSTRF